MSKLKFPSNVFAKSKTIMEDYIPNEIDYSMISQTSNDINLVELESFYEKNQSNIDRTMVVLILKYLHLFIILKVENDLPVLQDIRKYDLYDYCKQVADLISIKTFRNFPKDKKDLLQYILITFLIQPIFLKFSSLNDSDKQQCLLYRGMLEPGQPITYASLIFYDHYKYYYFPDATIVLLEFLYLCKKRVNIEILNRTFRDDSYPSLQNYLAPTLNTDVPKTILQIYNKFSLDKINSPRQKSIIMRKLENYLEFLHENSTDYASEIKSKPNWMLLEGINPLETVFPHAAIIKEKEAKESEAIANAKQKANLAMQSLLANEPSIKPSKNKRKTVAKSLSSKDKHVSEVAESTIARTPTTIHPTPVLEKTSCSIRDGAPINSNTNAVYEKAIQFCVEQSQIGASISPESLPVARSSRALGDLPTKNLVYGVSLLIVLTETLYNDESRRMLSRFIHGDGPVLNKDEMRKNVFQIVGTGSTFVDLTVRSDITESSPYVGIDVNDTDCAIVINPNLSEVQYTNVYTGIVHIINTIVCPSNPVTSDIVDIRTLKSKLSYTHDAVNVTFFKNYGYKTREGRVTLNISVFKVHGITLQNSILDITIYLRENSRIHELWKLYSINPYPELYGVPIPNPIALMMDQYKSSKLNTRDETEGGKGPARMHRVNMLKHYIPKTDVEQFITKFGNSDLLREIYTGGGAKRHKTQKRKSS